MPDAEPETHDFYVTLDGGNGWKAVQLWDSLALNDTERRNLGSGKPLDEPETARKAAILAYQVKDVFEEDVELMTGALDKADAVMGKCIDVSYRAGGSIPAVKDPYSPGSNGTETRTG